jgi:hypothetical protein
MHLLASLLLQSAACALEPVTLWPIHQEKILSPCEHVGFSFAETPQDQRDMRAAGAEFDGANFLVPLVNLSQEAVGVELRLDPTLLPAQPHQYDWFDALTGERLAAGDKPADVSLAGKGYRVLSCRRSIQEGQASELCQSMASRIAELKANGFETSYRQTCLDRARNAASGGRPEKVPAHENRFTDSPLVEVRRCDLTPAGDLQVEVRAQWPDGKPFADAVGVLKAVPLPNVFASLKEVALGQYAGTIPAADLVAYDYAERKYGPYAGPLQAIISLRRGRALAQVGQAVQ